MLFNVVVVVLATLFVQPVKLVILPVVTFSIVELTVLASSVVILALSTYNV